MKLSNLWEWKNSTTKSLIQGMVIDVRFCRCDPMIIVILSLSVFNLLLFFFKEMKEEFLEGMKIVSHQVREHYM